MIMIKRSEIWLLVGTFLVGYVLAIIAVNNL